ncbi:MAG: RNase adapter RapZ [Alphaproteobacteria bacterium]|nr:RNase adapter RapZ [Alphaproteobacteria bacterium]MCB1551608.1 RNase adapter RapZ [Alphaproteobacteria bacterium]MCB9985807.1 RNase adapter RapZ [Micavibrio sp.]
MKILEDLGYAAFDNFPLSLLDALLNQESLDGRPIAVAIDTRARDFNPVLLMDKINEIKNKNDFLVKTFFLIADEPVLLKRFNETRRKHPLAKDRSIADGIAAEKSLLFTLKHEAGYVIDSSDYSIHDLRRIVEGFADGLVHGKMNVTVMSFSYRYGLPREADLVIDVRFLRNPNWEVSLKDLTGLNSDVQDFVRGDQVYDDFLTGTKNLLDILLPRYQSEGKSYLTIAFGCTGGRHRSVTLAEEIGGYLENKNLPVLMHHREIKSV